MAVLSGSALWMKMPTLGYHEKARLRTETNYRGIAQRMFAIQASLDGLLSAQR